MVFGSRIQGKVKKMVQLSDDLEGTFPGLTFWVVTGDWNEKFQPVVDIKVSTRFFCTLESSLALRSVIPFLKSEVSHDVPFSISFWEKGYHNRLEMEMNATGIAFAETKKIYRRNDLEELTVDYLIAQLSGLKQ